MKKPWRPTPKELGEALERLRQQSEQLYLDWRKAKFGF